MEPGDAPLGPALVDQVMDSLPIGVLVVDLDDRVIDMNAPCELLLGKRRIEAVTEPLSTLFPAAVATVLRGKLLEALAGRAVEDVEIDPRDAPGLRVPLGAGAVPLLDPDGRPRGAIFLFRDLSLSREVSRLRQLDRMREEFVHRVSHELKTPIAGFLGVLDLLRRDAGRFPQEEGELIVLAHQAALRLRELVDDVLKIVRMESGAATLDPSAFLLGPLVEEVATSIATPSGVTIERSLPADLRVLADRSKLSEVLTNLLSNAVKYSPAGGTVRVCAAAEGDGWWLEVSDEGVGIPGEELPRLFTKFYRAERPEIAGIAGTGLGLSICRHLVEMHAGRIHVESEAGRGSRFRVVMPSRRA